MLGWRVSSDEGRVLFRYVSEGGFGFQEIREWSSRSAARHVDIRIEAIGPDFVIGTMPVDERTHQPLGLLHGGMSIVLAETLGSVASTLLVSDEPGTHAVGVEVNGAHLRGVRSGRVRGVCRALRRGRNMHFWQIEIDDGEGRPVCSARLTVFVVRGESSTGA